MNPIKVRVFTNFAARFFQPQESRPKSRDCPSNRHLHESRQRNEIQFNVLKNMQWQRQDAQAKDRLSAKLIAFNERMTKCLGPLEKYDCLVALQNDDIDLYYCYLCDNIVEVVSTINAIDDYCLRPKLNWTHNRLGNSVNPASFNCYHPNFFNCTNSECKPNLRNVHTTTKRNVSNVESLTIGRRKSCDDEIAELRKCLRTYQDIVDYVKPLYPYVSNSQITFND